MIRPSEISGLIVELRYQVVMQHLDGNHDIAKGIEYAADLLKELLEKKENES
jgi:hypothetical protein